ncbi:MAG: TonB-dependent receptor [Terriglobales bacterium]|jgi:outer membrane receptor protein involved in Fe transport
MANRGPILILPLFFVALAFPGLSAQTTQVDGVVRDASGAVIAKATVNLRSDPFRATTETDHDGRFLFSHVVGTTGTVEVSAEGFTVLRQSWRVEANETNPGITNPEIAHLEIVLQPSSANEQVTVLAARTEVRLSETPGSTVLLSTPDIAATPALRVDDVLRQVPGFSLYRRSDSRFAVASNQGVSLRGLGGTAASRAVVLEDGLPLVDAFGGWVYWDRIPREALSTVEVFRGGASNLYGSDALGGVVQFVTRQPQAPALNLETSYGNERTPDLSFWTGTRAGPWDVSLASEMFRTDGFVVVPSYLRGSIDIPANSEDATVDLNLGHKLGDQGRIFGRGNFFTEFRHNGTPLQTNDTISGEGAFGLDRQFGSNDWLSLRAYGLVQGYDEVFSAVAADRDSESLTDIQHVPEQVGGGGAQWTHLLGKSQTLIAGMDLMEVMGASDDQFYSSGTHTHNTAAGGRQLNLGWFGEDILRLRQKWTIILAGRFDDWSNFDDSSICTPVSGTCKSPSTLFPARNATAFDPRLSVLRALNSHVSLTASIYRAFRAPTLNELYRPFRVGDIQTNNNPYLNAERMTGAEAGVNVTGCDRKLDLRGTFFWSDIVDPVQNVTISQTSSLITREKENLGRIRSRGIEIDGVVHVKRDIQISAGYEFTAATVVSYPSPPSVSLVGLEVAQVPRNVFTWEARYWNPSRLLFSLQGRFVGQQFDDDQNQFPLDRFYTMDLEVGRALTRHLEAFAAAENLLDQRYQVARTPIVNIGPPILYRVGLRLNFPAER